MPKTAADKIWDARVVASADAGRDLLDVDLHLLHEANTPVALARVVVTSEDTSRVRRLDLPREVDVRSRDDIIGGQRELAEVPGVTVLVHDQECAAETRRKRKGGQVATPATRVVLNERTFEGCGACGPKSNYMSVHPIEIEFGRRTQIHQSSCNLDCSCLPFVRHSGGGREEASTDQPAGAPSGRAADSRRARRPDDFGLRITGIGGTGVVTVAQIIATAAVVDGHLVHRLGQTGPAQKGGAVVATYRAQLHPPLLRSMDLKIGLGPRTMPMFKALRWSRCLRGTRQDVSGYHPVRTLERELVEECRATIESALTSLTPDAVAIVTKMAGLPDQVRGYEQIRIESVSDYRRDLSEARDQLAHTVGLTPATTPAEE